MDTDEIKQDYKREDAMTVYKVGVKNPQNRTKKGYSFRLSEQAQKNLEFVQDKTGMNATAAIEYALALLRKTLA